MFTDSLIKQQVRIEHMSPAWDGRGYKPRVTNIDTELSEETICQMAEVTANASTTRIAKNAWFRIRLEGVTNLERGLEIIEEEKKRELERIKAKC